MPRAKGGSKTRQRHKKIMKLAKGYVGGRGRLYRSARETVERGLVFAYRDRRVKKTDISRPVDQAHQRRGQDKRYFL